MFRAGLPAVLAPGSSPVRAGRAASRAQDYRTAPRSTPADVPGHAFASKLGRLGPAGGGRRIAGDLYLETVRT
ncbi:MAG TPA: hypothetical protein VIM24_06575, partial [Candidatus Limnocylindrales bacterium]